MTADRQRNASPRAAAALLLLLAALLPGCVTPPRDDDRSISAGVRRVLLIDFGRAGTARHTKDLHRLPGGLESELRRVGNLIPKPRVATDELRRTDALLDDAGSLLATDLRRHPRGLDRFVPERIHFSQGIANMFDSARMLFGPGQRPLNEIDDRVHRTHHADDRPEKTLWQRIRRRLDL